MGLLQSKQKLSEEDLNFLKANTCYNEKSIQDWYNKFIQDCPDGKMTQTKFEEMYELSDPVENEETFSQRFFKTFDTSKKGYIDFKDYLLAINLTNAETPEEKLRLAFRTFDLDGNGELNMEEMASAVEDIFKEQMSNASINTIIVTAKNMYSQMDLDSDGCLTEEEFVSTCLKDNMLAQNMLLHRHFLDNSNDHLFLRCIAAAHREGPCMTQRAPLEPRRESMQPRRESMQPRRESMQPRKESMQNPTVTRLRSE